MKAYVIIVERKDGQPFYDEDIFCSFEDVEDSENEVQISFNKIHVEAKVKEYHALQSDVYNYRMVEVDVSI